MFLLDFILFCRESETRSFFLFAGDVEHYALGDDGTSATLYFESEQECLSAARHLDKSSFKGTG
jgi:hypothetical protein